MKNTFIIGVLLLFVFLAGCEDLGMNTRQGMAVGHENGRGTEAFAIGGGAGAPAGQAIGGAQDQRRAKQIAYERHLAAERAQSDYARAEAERARLMSYGYNVDAPEVLAARQRAEALESQVVQFKQEQAEAEARAREIEAYRAREDRAAQELEALRSQPSRD